MGKLKMEFSDDELLELTHDYEWNGFIFDEVIKYCAKCGLFPKATNIGDVQTYISKQIKIQMRTDTKIGRDTFNRWRKDGSKGPRDSETIFWLDTLIPDVHFLHRACDVTNKELLHQLYVLAWYYHYTLPMAIEGDKVLLECIKKCVKDKCIEDAGIEDEGTEDDLKKLDLYSEKLLVSFYKEYHCILTKNGATNIHAVVYNEEIILINEHEDELFFSDRDGISAQFKDILNERQACLEKFGDNLRKLFLGGDINA